MSNRVMRKFRHAGKKAVKFRFTATFEKLIVEGTRLWQPHKLAVVWSRRKRRKSTTSQSWRPGIENPYKGAVEWSKLNPEMLEIEVTLFKDERRGTFEAKDWVFALENEAQNGKRKAIATVRIDMTDHVQEIASPRPLHFKFKPLTSKLASADLTLTMRCEFLKEGAANDPDMASLAGSTTSEDTIRLGGVDIGDMSEFDDIEDRLSRRSGSLNSRSSSTKNQILELTQQIEMFSKGFREDDTDSSVPNQSHTVTDHVKTTQNANTRSSSRQASVSSTTAEKISLASSKSSQDKGEEKPRKDSSTEKNKVPEVNRHSSASESADGSEPSPVQKRRLKTTMDVFPTRNTDTLLVPTNSAAYGSPASEQHKPLLNWCQLVTTGYRGVKVTNFTTSWRNGLAFCAVLHYIKPDSVVYSDLKPLDGRDNLKKAFKGFFDLGFNIEEISKAMRTNSGGIATKAIIISFLTEVKDYYDKNNMGDTIEMLKKEKENGAVEKPESKQQSRVSLADFMREKLLSDLVEREGEDDVFSCVLDDVLEGETGPDVMHMSVSDDSVGWGGNDIGDAGDPTLYTISEDPFAVKEEGKVEDLPDPVKKQIEKNSSNRLEDRGDWMTTKMNGMLDSKEEDSAVLFPEPNTASIVVPTVAIDVHPIAGMGDGDTLDGPMSNKSKNRLSVTPPNSPVKRDFGSASDVHLANIESSLANIQNIMDSMPSTTESEEKPLPVGDTTPPKKDTALNREKPMTDKRMRARAFLEQFKAESVKKNEDLKTMSLSRNLKDGKRREEVKERAKKLIEETRASLDLKPIGFSYSTESVNSEKRSVELTAVNSLDSDKYATLPLNPKPSWDKNESEALVDFKQEIQESFVLDEDSQDSKIEISEETTLPQAPNEISIDLDQNIEDGARLTPAKLVPTFPTSILTFSPSEKPQVAPTEEPQPVEPEVVAKNSESEIASFESKIAKNDAVVAKAEKEVTKTDSHDYNGNSVEIENSGYLMIARDKSLAFETNNITSNKHSNDSTTEPESVVTENFVSNALSSESNSSADEESDLFITESLKPDLIADLPRLSETLVQNHSEAVEITLDEVDSSVSVLVVENNPFEISEDKHEQSLPEIGGESVRENREESEMSDQTSLEDTTDASSTRVETLDIAVAIEQKPRLSEEEDKPIIKILPETPKEILHDPLGAVSTPVKMEPSVQNQLPVQYTSTPVVDQTTVKFRNPKNQPSTNGTTPVLKSPLTLPSNSPVRVTAVKPVQMSDLETFSPILSSPAKSQLRAESPRSRPTSVKLSRRKSSASSIRKSIAANDKSSLEQEKVALEEEMRQVDDRMAEVQEELQEQKNSARGKSKQREEILTQEWFQLVQKKNAIVREQDMLLLLEQEHDLGAQMNEINEQLRPYMEIEESQKTEAQKMTEKGLLDQLVCLVNERDRIIQTIDENEQTALDDDMHVQTNLEQNMSTVFDKKDDEKCVVM